jgi:starch synthase
MKTRLRILYLSSEVAPFVKNGRIAEIAGALPKALFEMGHDIRVMMPKYGTISERKYTLREVIRLKEIPIQQGDAQFIVNAKSAFLPETKVQVYFLDYKPYFDKLDLSLDAKTGQETADNALRFILFCRAALETSKLLHWDPQLIFCNDWSTALIPWLLKNEYLEDPFFSKCASLLAVHDFKRQGVFPETILKQIGLNKEPGAYQDLVHNGRANLLKAGLLNADIISAGNTIHLSHVWKEPELAFGLFDVLKRRKEHLTEVLDGIDYNVWNPETDRHLIENYSVNQLKGKLTGKQELLSTLELSNEENRPLLALFFDSTDGKNGDAVFDVLERLLGLTMNVVLVFSDEACKRRGLEKLRKNHHGQLAVVTAPDEALQHRLIAGCDLTLMADCTEQQVAQQMIHLRYGAIPLVNKIGCVLEALGESGEGKCKNFYFDECDKKAVYEAVKSAVLCYQDDKSWQKMVKKALKLDFCWKNAAEKYIKLLQRLENTKKKK